jgi:hypothetical protein
VTNSSRPPAARKPVLKLHFWEHKGTGRWCEKVRGSIGYVGHVQGDLSGEKALELWTRWKDDLLTGRKPREDDDAIVSVFKICNRFLQAKRQPVGAGESKELTWKDYKATCGPVTSTSTLNGATRLGCRWHCSFKNLTTASRWSDSSMPRHSVPKPLRQNGRSCR